VLLGDDSAMDDIPLFHPAGAQAWRAYYDLIFAMADREQ
jgi:hypothetical protein